MGFWGRLFGRTEYDTTVTEYQAAVTEDAAADVQHGTAVPGNTVAGNTTGAARPFLLPIEDVFFITGRGTVATGTVSTGILTVGDAVQVHKADGTRVAATVTGIETFRKTQTSAHPGQMIGVLLDSVTRHDLARGDTLEA